MSGQQPPPLLHGIVKQVQSGDSIIVRSNVRGRPPKERALGLSNIVAPKLARRSGSNPESFVETKDEPYAWEAREFLRKKLVGKEVCFTVEKAPNANKEYGILYLGKDTSGENIAESLVSEGLVDVRRTLIKSTEFHQKLCDLEEAAKLAGKGKHGSDCLQHVRDVKWTMEDPRKYVDSYRQQPIKAIVDYVRDGSTLRLLLTPDFHYITLMLSGIKCPFVRPQTVDKENKDEKDKEKSDPFAEEAKFFTECRLLQRDVEVILESVSNQNFLGTVLHPNGNIAELLLSEGFARCVDWNLQFVSAGPEKLRAAEKRAKEKRLRLWKDYAPTGPIIDAKDREYQAKVVEIINADALVLKLADGSFKKIFLASIRPPKLPEEKQESQKANLRSRPLYDIPHMFEAREFLRKKLIGKKVNVTVDYVQPARDSLLEKICCTISIGGVNVAEALVSKGLATVVRYRANDDQRSTHYDELLAAETKATKSGKGLHNKKDAPPHRVVDLAGDQAKSKQFLPFLQRAGRMEAIVEFITSGSRLRLYVPRENCLLTFLLGGITCPRARRLDPKTNATLVPAEPFGDEALAYTKDLCMQREVEIEVESMDKAGNFIGWLWIEGINLSISLVQEGFAVVHFSAERSSHFRSLKLAESEAQRKNIKVWENHVIADIETKEEEGERKFEPKFVTVTEVRPEIVFFAQSHENGPDLENLLRQLRHEFATNAPLPGSYSPKKNDICAALFSEDKLWYRARIEKVEKNSVVVTYVDYGNREITSATNLAVLPATYRSLPFAAQEYGLAFVKLPNDPDSGTEAAIAFKELVGDSPLMLNKEYKIGSTQYVTLLTPKDKIDIGKDLVENGFLMVDKRKEKKFQEIITDYLTAQDLAKKNRLNLWCYGDITEDDAKEFG